MVLFIGFALVSFWIRTHPTAPPPPPKLAPLHLHLGHQYRGQFVKIYFDDHVVFAGRVQTAETTPHAATLLLQPPAERFQLEVDVTPASAPMVSLAQKIHLAEGRHLLVVLTSEKRLDVFQSEKAPDFL